MLARLSIRDIILIDRLDIEFTSGLSVLTGETGAGKSILLDAFALALGARGDVALVRQGAEQGQVTAAFELPSGHPVRALMAENDIPAEDELILRRVQFADGRTRAFVNDQPLSAQALKALGMALVEIHGQHDERALVDCAAHRRLLDAFGALDGKAAEVERLWNERRARAGAVAAHRAEVERAKVESRELFDWFGFMNARFELLDGDAEILPGLNVITTPGHTVGHQCVVVQVGDAESDLLIGDAAYDSDPLDDYLLETYDIELIAPHKCNRKRFTQDGRPFRRYRRRWCVERLFAWLHWFRRLVIRWEYHAENFLGMVQLGCIMILLRHI